MIFGIIGTSLVFIIAMRSTASEPLETNFEIDYEEQPIIQSEGQTNASNIEAIDPRKEEFIHQQEDFEKIHASTRKQIAASSETQS